ncbi:glutamine amidotransferase [Novipirellula rosea]|uniref:VWFA domain-containing protein n=1 Tax=Novipirellula rosea TaxID=1031540 RepID=A0ABP8NEB0_9BACT
MNLELLPQLSPRTLLSLFAVLAVAAIGVRLMWGPPAQIARRSGLVILRCLVVLLLLIPLFNPVQVSETPGHVEHNDVLYLLDESESMNMVNDDQSRWDQAIGIIRDAKAKTTNVSANTKSFRFGSRLSAIESKAQNSASEDLFDTIKPTSSDTRLRMALQQITSRFGRARPASVVVFSDGRVRDSEGIEELAKHFAELNVPIHVAPVGDAESRGDLAIIAAVIPESVRRHSRVEVQVFTRSFGLDDQRAELHLTALDRDGNPLRAVTTPQPLTLRDGFQSHRVSFRADEDTQRLLIHIPPNDRETTSQNNSIEATTFIDHTKIRVLYVEGSPQRIQAIRQGNKIVYRGAHTELQEALVADNDIECIVVSGGGGMLTRITNDGSPDIERGFAASSAELAAFDVLILSNISREMFTEEQIDWITSWVSRRGAGLCMLGGPNSFSAGGWAGTAIETILPVTMQEAKFDWDPGAVVQGKVDLSGTLHPIWHLVSAAKTNRKIIEQFPVFDGVNESLRVNDPLATTLVSGSDDTPVLSVGRYGKGRSAAMATAITEPWARAFLNEWGEGDDRYFAKFWRNMVYWLAEDSTIGRRRLIASHDKQYYKPGETMTLRAVGYDEGAKVTQDYRIVAMIEPKSTSFDLNNYDSPFRWPNGVQREEGMEGPMIMWGEEFELPRANADTDGPLGVENEGYAIELQINDAMLNASANEGLRIELTAMDGQTQVDSTSLDVHILHDPFELQNPFPDHDLLQRVAAASGGSVIHDSDDLAAVLNDLDVKRGPPVVRKSPLWSTWWLWALIVGMLTTEWFWRRSMGLA